MRKNLLGLLWTLLLTISLDVSAKTQAASPVFTGGFFEMEKVMKSLDEGKEIETKLKDFFTGKQKELAADQEKFKKLRDEYEGQRKILNDDKRLEKEKELQALLMSIQEKTGRYQQELTSMRQSLNEPLIKKIREAARDIGKRRKFNFVAIKGEPLLDYALVYVEKEVDFTDDVIAALKKKK